MEKISTSRDNNFNFLRLFFAVSVILSHSPELTDGNRHREPLTRIFNTLSLGELSVDCFFILSGFLIVQSWERKPALVDFLKKRVLRIYPAFLVAALISALIVGPMGSESARYFSQFKVLHFVRDIITLKPPMVAPVFVGQPQAAVNVPMWSIAYEFRCYLLVALLGLCGIFKHRRLWLGLFVAVLIVGQLPDLLIKIHLPGFNFFFGDPLVLFRMLPFFCVGGCFYLYRDKINFKPIWGIISIFFLIVCFFQIRTAQLSLVLMGSYLLFYISFARFAVLERFKIVSDVSYGIYLYGWPVQKLLMWYFPQLSPWLLFPLATLAAFVCGLLSWKFVEQPFLHLKTRRNVTLQMSN